MHPAPLPRPVMLHPPCPTCRVVTEFEIELVEAAEDAENYEQAMANPVLMSQFQNFFVTFLGENVASQAMSVAMSPQSCPPHVVSIVPLSTPTPPPHTHTNPPSRTNTTTPPLGWQGRGNSDCALGASSTSVKRWDRA